MNSTRAAGVSGIAVGAAVAMILGFAATSTGASLDGRAILDKAEDINAFGLDGSYALVNMDLIKGSAVRSRKIEAKSMDIDSRSHTLMRITAPPDLAGMAFLTIENVGRDDDQWLYLPEIGKAKRIKSSDRSGSLFGSDFTYEDVQPRDLDEGNHRRLPDESPDGVPCYVVETISKDPSTSSYGKSITYVRKSDWMPKQIKLFDKKGALWKFLALDPPVKHPAKTGTRLVTKRLIMANLKRKTQTRMTITKLDLTVTHPPTLFTPGSLTSL
jgi:hypothetical protein